jgi:mono/diheme cytochrome c family protein
MKYIKIFGLAAFVALAAFLYFAQTTKADDTPAAVKDGKTLFTDKHCDGCHAIESQSIEARNKSTKAPDLSKVNLKGKTDWIKSFLNKETDLDGKNHPMKFNGTDDELNTLAAWIESIATAVADSTQQK